MPNPKMFIYFPFQDEILFQVVETTGSYYDKKKFDVDFIMPGKSLAGVGNADQLLIAGECAAGVGFIGDKQGNKMEAADLAGVMQTGGLSKAHKEIHLWACHSGGTGFFSPMGLMPNTRTIRDSLAGRFWLAMKKLEYNTLTVYGYLFMIADAVMGEPGALEGTEAFQSGQFDPQKAHFLGSPDDVKVGIDPTGSTITPSKVMRLI